VPRYKLTIAYDGTNFCGWQKQEPPAGGPVAPEKVLPKGGTASDAAAEAAAESAVPTTPDDRVTLRTVQEVIERAVREVVREPAIVMGASRTDAGVHAKGQVAAFTCGEGWPTDRGTDKLILALNSRLPRDVVVIAAEIASPTFDPIGDCTAKAYSYLIHVSPNRPLWDRDYVHHVWSKLDVDLMNQAAARLIGEHDFAAFAAAGHGRLSTVRTIFTCSVTEETSPQHSALSAQHPFPNRRIRIDVSGNGFLWNMVRIIAGTLLDAGRGWLSPDDVSSAIQQKDRRKAGPTLPARGLCLEWVKYKPDIASTA